MASNKPPAVQAAVIVKAMNGDSKRQIAEDLGMGRNTVTAILGDTELNQVILDAKTSFYRLAPKAVAAFDKAITKGQIPEASVVLRVTGILPQENSDSGGVTVNLGVMARSSHA